MKTVHKLTVIALLWLIFVNSGSIASIDTKRRMQMAHAWWTGTEEGIPGDTLVINVNNKNYIPYDLGQSMLMLPGDWLGNKLAQNIAVDRKIRQQFTELIISFFIFLPINLLTVVMCFHLLRLFDYSEKLAGLSSIILLLGTSFLFYTTFPQQNNQILLFVLIGYQTILISLKKNKKRFLVFSGIALGITFLIRITSLLYAASVIVFLVGCICSQFKRKSLSKSFKSVLLWLSGFVPFILIERILTYYRYGSWTATSTSLHIQIYQQMYSEADLATNANNIARGVNNDFSFLNLLKELQLEGFLAPFFSPEKSIFLYDPLLIPCLIILLICWKFLASEIKWYLIAVIFGFLLHLYIYAWNTDWIGHSSFGARYHITSVHLFLIPLIPLLVRGATKKIEQGNFLKKAVIYCTKFIIIVSILLQFSSIMLPSPLEQTQQYLGVGSRFRFIQRINNIYYLFKDEREFYITNSEVINKYPELAPNRKINWEIFPLKLKSKLNNKSSFSKLIPIIILIWIIIFILAVASTVWIFI